ncbi:sodium/potassium-transporting ATPase subunit beta-1-interacting protein 3-like [Sycon ciliatum]|uniref:sodium/potassium-transporting ATPase subunit beta-1-interacting protein 3-like n=1 Tax=Sycon ciliatum TaxID=27933 RepID=UPI0020ABA622|eukprot:scpid32455/ scgid33487/ Sodium/potassium-transporting ATPase subunit beta-1-interacting protein 4
MGCCRMTNVLYALLALDTIATCQRLIFDFIGGMYGTGTANILNLLIIIIAALMLFNRRPGLLLTTCIWYALWIGINIIIILIYHRVLLITNNSNPSDNYLLNMDSGHSSWWKDEGINCENVINTTTVRYATGEPDVTEYIYTINCLLSYEWVETIQAAIQILFSLMLFCFTAHYVHVGLDEDTYESIVGMSSYPHSQSPTNGHPVQVQMRPLPM